jgi:tripartite-type tricarboxylate transporter receptor subunit TctC
MACRDTGGLLSKANIMMKHWILKSAQTVASVACVGAALVAAPAAWAQAAWPSKPIKFVAVFPPGGSVDQVARILAVPLSQQLGQNIIVENKGGASGAR